MIDDQPPRMIGMMAARNLAISIEQNPMAAAPIGELRANQPGHPRHEWAAGFRDARILMHMQQSRNLALGKGLVLMIQTAPREAEVALIEMGKQAGETVCIALLGAILETDGTQYDLRCPETILAIYGAMKQRMSDKPPHCQQPGLQSLVDHTHQLAGILKVLFTTIDRGTIQLDRIAMRNLLRDIAEMNALDQKAIATGQYAAEPLMEIPCDACGGNGGRVSENSGQTPHHCKVCDGSGEKQPPQAPKDEPI